MRGSISLGSKTPQKTMVLPAEKTATPMTTMCWPKVVSVPCLMYPVGWRRSASSSPGTSMPAVGHRGQIPALLETSIAAAVSHLVGPSACSAWLKA